MVTRSAKRSFFLTGLCLLHLMTAAVKADHCAIIFVTQDSNPNTVGIMRIRADNGMLELLGVHSAGVDARGTGDGALVKPAIPQIAAKAPLAADADGPLQGCLFVANALSHNVSAFTFNPVTERLTAVAGSPFPTKGLFGREGGGVALTPDGALLYTSNPESNNISTFLVNPNCSLELLALTPAPAGPGDIQVSPNNACLAVASTTRNSVAMYDLFSGVPNPVAEVIVDGPGRASGVEFSAFISTPKLYIGKANSSGVTVAHYQVSDDCRLSNPVVVNLTRGEARNSYVTKLTPDEDCLFVPNPGSNHLTTFSVNPDTGDLTLFETYPNGARGSQSSAAVFAPTGPSPAFYTNGYNPRQVARRPVEGCRAHPIDQVIGTGVPGPGLRRALALVRYHSCP